MFRLKRGFSFSMTLLFILCLSTFSPFIVSAEETISYNGSVKPLDFYFHYLDQPSEVGGIESKYIMNTNRVFRFNTDLQAFSASFFKPVGLPKITTNFYLSPSLLAPIKLDGEWKVSIWVNSTAYKPATFGVQYREVSMDGLTLWDSGQLSPMVTSSIGDYLDVPVRNFVLTSRIEHTFEAGSSLEVIVEVNAGSSSAIRIWYDSLLFPSKVTLPATNYARPITVSLFSFDGSKTDLFDYTWSQEKRTIDVVATVNDPFGVYDINKVSMRIFYNGTHDVSGTLEMQHEPENLHQTLNQTYSAKWSYPLSAQIGNYTVRISVIDNNGANNIIEKGYPEPYIEYLTHDFQIGPIVYYNPLFRILDDTNDVLQEAQVYVTWPNGLRDVLPRYTGIEGNLTLTKVVPGQYGLTVLWRDIVVNQTTLIISSDGPYIIKSQVFELKVDVKDNAGNPVKGAYVLVYSRSGLCYGFNMTSQNGQTSIKLPSGIYNLTIHYRDLYWLTPVTEIVERPSISVRDNLTESIIMKDYPPPIWETTGFIIVSIGVIVAIAILIMFYKKKQK